jgi:hypothetical protein
VEANRSKVISSVFNSLNWIDKAEIWSNSAIMFEVIRAIFVSINCIFATKARRKLIFDILDTIKRIRAEMCIHGMQRVK